MAPDEKKATLRKQWKKRQKPKGFIQNYHHTISLVTAEISLYPVGTDTTSLSFYIAKSIESISTIKDISHTTTPMGTILESDDINKIFEATKIMTETIHRLGVRRVEVILKIDSRTDKKQSAQDKMNSLKKHLKGA